MSMDAKNKINLNNTKTSKQDEMELAAFQADLDRLEFLHRVETGDLTEQELADWNELMS